MRTLADVYKEIDEIKPTQNTWTYLGTRGSFYIFTSGVNPDTTFYDYHAIPTTVITTIKELK